MSQIQPIRTVTQHLEAFRRVLVTATTETRSSLNAFWRDVRQSLNDQDRIIIQLQERINTLEAQSTHLPQPSTTPDRPHTSHSVDVVRATIDRALINEGLYFEEASSTIDQIFDLDPAWVEAFLQRQRSIYLTNELGCWLSGNAPAHENGYVKVNMRNTGNPDGSGNFTCQPFAHQLGVVANGSGSMLRMTTDSVYHVCCP